MMKAKRGGFTLPEMLVATMMLTVGIMALASTGTTVSRIVGATSQQMLAGSIATSRFETLRASRCSAITSGSQTTRSVSESWTVAAAGTRLFTVIDTVRYTAINRNQPVVQVYRSVVRC